MDTSTALWTLFAALLIGLTYFAAFVFALGLVRKLISYLRTPMPLPHALTPAPTTEAGAIRRVLGDVLIFPNLFKADRWLWAGAWIFHVALGAILLRHLRYFTYPVPDVVIAMQQVALFFGYVFGITAVYLFWRRLALPRSLYISNLPDYFALILMAAIAGTGLLMTYWVRVDLVEVKAFMLGLLTLNPIAPPPQPLFLLHFCLVLALLMYFPFSKLLHAGGIFMSPSRNQPFQVQVRGKRYVNPWDNAA
jgi:nitrate reductase gamma subunit